MKTKLLRNPAQITNKEIEILEREIMKYLTDLIYKPLVKSIPAVDLKKIQNSKSDVLKAIKTGRIIYSQGRFKGNFTASISKELSKAGAKWDAKTQSWKLSQSLLPQDFKKEISLAEALYSSAQASVFTALDQVMHDIEAKSVDFTRFYDGALLSMDLKLDKQLEAITVAPQLTVDEMEKISREYSNNLNLYIKKFSKEHVLSLRKKIEGNFYSGNRYENLYETIKRSYSVSDSKAKFLARQETKLLSMKYQEARMTSAGSQGYIWRCVKGSPKHPVRADHKKLDGKPITWDSPPVVDTRKGRKAHAGEDFGCRCTREIVFKFN